MTTATVTKTPAEKLAREFSRLMRRDLTAAEMKKANALNAKQADKKVCHTHDFIDANMTMAEAFEALVGHSPEVHEEDEASRADVALWNEAWDIAKAANFFVGKTVTVLGEDKKPVDADIIRTDKGGVDYVDPRFGHTVSAAWRLMFIREALELVDEKAFNEMCDLVGMPQEYDWSFIRDADSMTLVALSEKLYHKVGAKMKKMGLSSVAKFRGGL